MKTKFCVLRTIIFLAVLLMLSSPQCFAQLETGQGQAVLVDADDVEYTEDDKIIGKGNVKVDYGSITLYAQEIKVDLTTRHATATNKVVLVQEGIRMSGDDLFFDFENKQGTMDSEEQVSIEYEGARILSNKIAFDLEKREAYTESPINMEKDGTRLTGEGLLYRFESETGEIESVKIFAPPWYGQACIARKTEQDQYVLENAYVSTCEYEEPHYRIKARRIEVYPGDKVIARSAVLYLGRLPVFYFPYWRQSLEDRRTNFSLTPGYKKDWGGFLLTSWGYYLNEDLRGRIHLDYRELKGPAYGVDADYDSARFGTGEFQSYYAAERDEAGTELTERDRYRVQARYHWDLDPDTTFIGKFHKISDNEFVKDYLYREYEDNVQPVTEASLSGYAENYSWNIYARKRINRFYSVVERLPEMEYSLYSQQIGDAGLFYRNEFSAANLNIETPNMDDDLDANRLHTYNELKYVWNPFGADWLNFVPYAGTTQTYYSKDRTGQQEDFIKGAFNSGFGLDAQFFRMFDTQGSFLGIEVNRLRHILRPALNYTYIHEPTVSPARVGAFDEIDAIDATNQLKIGIENHLQTKREDETVELAYFYPYIVYASKRYETTGSHFSNLFAELDLKPYSWLNLFSDWEFNQDEGRFQTANVDLRAIRADQWHLTLGHRYEHGISDQVTGDIYYRLNDNWQIGTYARYLVNEGSFQERQFTVYRDLHCWLMEVTYNVRSTDDFSQDRTIWLTFRVKAFPEDTPIRMSAGYSASRRGE